ncbi:hypothetical protein [uncultured Fibrobacter sp.]|uniref:hypothetical protein n=1 Tax=uncultured Fibrobacter sp. TaxID=261512 RepID=UPI0025FFEEA6|nr:hypothetical protein [uncultured Fibrobacter sp.]
MTNIFLSRPTYVPQEQQQGIDVFCSLLDMMDFCPRTLGTTDYPNESPLDEIIRILDTCSGMIVLGIPQLFIEKGILKGNQITSPLKLATEWNQIEAALAYSRNMPLLIIHDKDVSRGIFDHGALGNFIHETDFSDLHWSESLSIRGALKTWKEKVVCYTKVSVDSAKSVEMAVLLNALKNDFTDMLNKTYYYKKYNKSATYDYASYLNDNGQMISLTDFLVRKIETWYEQEMRRCGNKTKNDILNEINRKFPQVYEKIRFLFEKGHFNSEELEQCFVI